MRRLAERSPTSCGVATPCSRLPAAMERGLVAPGLERLSGSAIQSGRRLTLYTRNAAPVPSRATRQARALREAQEPRFKLDDAGLAGAGPPRRSGHHLQPRNRRGAVGGELAGSAVDRQHHEGHDGGGVPRGPSRSGRKRSSCSAPTCYRASTTYLRAGYKVTMDDLLHLLLIASDNAAARALARVSPHGSDGFIDRMNEKAAELGLDQHALRRPVRAARRRTCRRRTTWRA